MLLICENLRDLNFEYKAGKVPDADYWSMRASLEELPDPGRPKEIANASAVVFVTLLFVPLLIGQQQPQRKTFADCDKTAQTQADLTECGSTDYKSVNDELSWTYQQLLKKAAGDSIAVQKIKAAQSAWVAFRDAQIAALYPAEDKQKEYGTVFPMCANLALADLTKERTKMLKQMLNPVEGDVCGGGLWYPDLDQTASPNKHNQ